MLLYYASIALTVIANVAYHLSQKLTSSTINPLLSLAVTYITATLICLVLFPFYPNQLAVAESLRQLNWTSFALGFAVVGLEVGFLLAYRAGWDIGLAAIFSNAAVTVLLVPIGILLFKEHISLVNILGVGICIVGLVLVNQG
jgi:uncharacterized membrane protein